MHVGESSSAVDHDSHNSMSTSVDFVDNDAEEIISGLLGNLRLSDSVSRDQIMSNDENVMPTPF